MTSNTPSGTKKHHESAEPESRQMAKICSSSDGLSTLVFFTSFFGQVLLSLARFFLVRFSPPTIHPQTRNYCCLMSYLMSWRPWLLAACSLKRSRRQALLPSLLDQTFEVVPIDTSVVSISSFEEKDASILNLCPHTYSNHPTLSAHACTLAVNHQEVRFILVHVTRYVLCSSIASFPWTGCCRLGTCTTKQQNQVVGRE